MNTPVALFVYNRPGLTEEAVRRLAAIRPGRLFVVADGPKNAEDARRCNNTLHVIDEGVTWPCRVEKRVSSTNLGCRIRFESGLDWVFSRAREAVILEDDIEVAPSFFDFAGRALEVYRKTPAVRMVTARNVLVSYPDDGAPFFSRKGSVWGWATWADRWQRYRRLFPETPRSRIEDGIRTHSSDDLLRDLQLHLLDLRLWERIDTWDMPWSLWNLSTNGLSLTPAQNLSANHGLGNDATHTRASSDVRGSYPVFSWSGEYSGFPSGEKITREGEVYDSGCTLLEMLLNYVNPRRWKVMSAGRRWLPETPEARGWELMLRPFDRPQACNEVLSHLKRWITHPDIDRLLEAFQLV